MGKGHKGSISGMKWDIITDPVGTGRVIREFYEQLYIPTPDNLDAMDQFFEKHKLPQLTQYEIDHLNSSGIANLMHM